MDKLKVGVMASGRGSNLQAIVDASESGIIPARVVLVISDLPGAYALERAKRHGISAVYVNPREFCSKDDYENKIVTMMKEHGVELICLAGYMRIIGRSMLEAFTDRIMNIHPALLPAFKGLHGQKQAFDYGVRYSGCTVHLVDEGMDTGPIILQSVVPVMLDDTEEDLAARILEQEHTIYPQAVDLYARGRLKKEGRKIRILPGENLPG